MSIVSKSRAAAEFRAKADAIRAELTDVSRSFTLDEVKARTDEIAALEERAQRAAEFTPEAEIERQGGFSQRNAPEAQQEEADYTAQYEALVKKVRKTFGGPNGMLLAMARRVRDGLTEQQKRVVDEVNAFHQRAIVGTAGDASGGEFLLPLQQVSSIFTAQMAVGGIADTATRFPVSGRTLRIPLAGQTDGDVTRPMAGIANVTIVGEGGEKPQREPTFTERLLTVYKWAAYSEFGDEVLADDFTGSLAPTVQQLVGGQIVNTMNEFMTLDGTGSGQPLGAFNTNNGALYKVARETAGDFTVEDAFEMYARHVLGPQSRWYIHPSVLPKFMNLTLAGTTLVTQMRDLQGAPQLQLLGIPVVVTPLVSVVGTEADVCLGNGAFYAMAVRQALTVESSIHYKFRDDKTAYRFFARGGGLPIPENTYSYKSAASVKEYEVSPFVVLDNVVAS